MREKTADEADTVRQTPTPEDRDTTVLVADTGHVEEIEDGTVVARYPVDALAEREVEVSE